MVDDSVAIRLMKTEDLERVAEIFLAAFNGVGEHWSRETALQHICESFFDQFHYVAMSDREIVGFILAIPLIREKGKELFIDTIAVLPEFQNKGIGKMLWEKITVEAKNNNLVGIRLLSNPHLASFNWYKKIGFKESGWIEVFNKIK